jgi:hypothetical protein
MQHKRPLAITTVAIFLLDASACSAPHGGEGFVSGHTDQPPGTHVPAARPTVAPASAEPTAPTPEEPVIPVPPPASDTWEVTETEHDRIEHSM